MSFYEVCIHNPIGRNKGWMCHECGEVNEPEDYVCMSEECVELRKVDASDDE